VKIQTSHVTAPASPTPHLRNKNIPAGATVTHDAKTDTFTFSAPGISYSVGRYNPLSVAAQAGVLVGVPSLVGALQNQAFGTVAAGLGGTWTGIAGGLALGAAIGGYKSYHGSNKNPLYGVLGGLGGAAAGAVMFPLLKQPGLWGGYTGAAIATGAAALGLGIYTAVNNHNITQDAKALGWNPKAG
jgi:hypothetical protein